MNIAHGNCFESPWQELRPGIKRVVFGMEAENICCTIGRVENGNEVKPHAHPNEQIAIVLEGECDYYVDGVPYRLVPGSWVVVPPNVIHYIHVYDSTVPCLQMDIFYPDRPEYTESYTEYCKNTEK